MTGFGRAQVAGGAHQVAAEVRSLNQRFFELKLNLPRGWGEHEGEIRKLVQAVVARGRVELVLRTNILKPPRTHLRVNEGLARRYVEELRRVGKRLRLDGKLGIEVILQRPEIFQVVEEDTDDRPAVALGLRTVKRALAALESERIREGRALKRDFAARLNRVRALTTKIAKLAEVSRAALIGDFQARVRELLANVQIADERRLYEDAASIAQRADITEELTRLEAHLAGLRGLLDQQPAGKEIEFLLQEINREVNTIGSKSQSAALSHHAVAIKSELEKMREQVQNVE